MKGEVKMANYWKLPRKSYVELEAECNRIREALMDIAKLTNYECSKRDLKQSGVELLTIKQISEKALKPTNADRIRQASDEELLDWLVDHACLLGISRTERCSDIDGCRKCWKRWLKYENTEEEIKND